jgi:hypothetical protein
MKTLQTKLKTLRKKAKEGGLLNLAVAGAIAVFGALGLGGSAVYAQSDWDIIAGIAKLHAMSNTELTYEQRAALATIAEFAETQGEREFQREITKEGAKQTITINYETGKQAQLVKDEQGNHYLLVDGVIYRYQDFGGQGREPEVTGINKTWMDWNAEKDGKRGMTIHAKIGVDSNKGHEYFVGAYFCDRKGNPLKDKDGKYCTIGGEVMVGKTLTSSYGNFSDVELFIPDKQFEIKERGTYLLQFHICLWDLSTSELLDQTEWTPFEYFVK